jgi:hypothetical protein
LNTFISKSVTLGEQNTNESVNTIIGIGGSVPVPKQNIAFENSKMQKA